MTSALGIIKASLIKIIELLCMKLVICLLETLCGWYGLHVQNINDSL